MLFSDKIRVGVLRGGPSNEYKVSLETGKNVLQNLPEEHYLPVDIFISKDGTWHEGGLARSPDKVLKKVDVVWNALHGSYGEDGTVQKILESFGMPYTGATSLPSAFGMNKVASKKIYNTTGLKTPHSISIPFETLTREAIKEAYNSIPAPFVVKPSSSGSSVGVHVVSTLPDLEEAVVEASNYSPIVLVEEYIAGKEATCGVVDGFRGSAHYALLPIEIRHQNDFFNYDSKYSDSGAEEICPGNFSKEEMRKIEEMAVLAHKALGLRHYSRSDFRVHPKRGIYILETNSLPGLTKNSLIPKALSAAGSNISEFLHHVLGLALNK